jgi:predicted dehydrogenase
MNPKPKQIGFIDYDLNNFHANTFLKLFRNELKHREWMVTHCWAKNETTGKEWADKNAVHYCSDIKEMADCDGLMILAPGKPELHLELAEKTFPLGIPTYVDKTFAPSLMIAKEIYALADRHKIPIISSSALRFCRTLQNQVTQFKNEEIRHIQTWFGGRSFEEYAIHPIEMAVSVMGPDIIKVSLFRTENHCQILINFSNGRTANVFSCVNVRCDAQAVLITNQATTYVNCKADPFYEDCLLFILNFFEQKKELIDRKETLAIRSVLDATSTLTPTVIP